MVSVKEGVVKGFQTEHPPLSLVKKASFKENDKNFRKSNIPSVISPVPILTVNV